MEHTQYTFDMVFDQAADNAQVYDTCAAPLVAGVLQGLNATVVMFGQTGSGKSADRYGSGLIAEAAQVRLIQWTRSSSRLAVRCSSRKIEACS